MHALDRNLRNKLEKAVIRAREVAEEAAKSALEQLGVEQSVSYAYLSAEQRELRRRLRSHGRQLGDKRDPITRKQEIEMLTEEVAYEHWHRMLFARFLAENQLLMFYEGKDIENAVAVSLEECEEMAKEIGYANGWELAAKLAAKMLPQIFRPESPVFEMRFSPENQKELEVVLSELVSEVFTASDSLGWVYQFWQTKKKEEVNKARNKIGARELPVVTQIFTEPYMVSFLLDNSLGAWWVRKRLNHEDFKNAVSEDELREKASLPGVPLEFLRFIKDENGYWSPAGGTFEGWPDRLSEFKVLDPCCGSGHFLVSAFLMLVLMRMELKGLSARESVDAVLNENLHGLEIDQRCVELAAFAVALMAWKYPDAGGFRELPDLQIAWCGQSVNVKKEEWLTLAEGDNILENHLEEIHNLFKDAPVLGSLINPRNSFESGDIFEKNWKNVSKLLLAKLDKKKNENDELGIVAQGMEKAFLLLSDKYHLVITNIPYLGRSKMNDKLRYFLTKEYSKADKDLALAIIKRCLQFLYETGEVYFVTSSNWTFLKRYEEFRRDLLKSKKWTLVIEMGYKSFSTQMYDFPVSLMGLKNILPCNSSSFSNLSIINENENKAKNLIQKPMINVKQHGQLSNPDSRILIEQGSQRNSLLEKFAFSKRGIVNGDNDRWLRFFWEIKSGNWRYLQTAPQFSKFFTGRDQVINWSTNGKQMLRPGIKNPTYGLNGISITRMKSLDCTLYTGEFYDQNVAVIVPHDQSNIESYWCFCNSKYFKSMLRQLDKKIGITPATFLKVPFDLEHWQKVAEEKYPDGLPKPYSDDPTQWISHGHPSQSEAPLQVAVARLLGYRWPAEMDKDMELSDEARELIIKCNDLLPYADKEGIVCIPSVRGGVSASDRLLNLLAMAYKDKDINAILSELLAAADYAGKSLDSWLRDKFFTQHIKLFSQRPFIWHIWDGLSDGFAILVNYHKLDRKNLETLIYTYLGDWIKRQKEEIIADIDGAEEKLAAAENLKKCLELILEGEAPHDIFVRWKPIHLQPIGWEPDINDGVRMNIRPFISVPDVGKKGAGILRDKPNIKWGIDRGKDTVSNPWYHIFKGERINDYHLSLDEKKRAKEEERQRRQ